MATIVANFKALSSQPVKVVQLFGGQIVAQLLVITALGTALHTFGAQLSLAALIIGPRWPASWLRRHLPAVVWGWRRPDSSSR